jgi:histidinol-phosphatase (PHP family)
VCFIQKDVIADYHIHSDYSPDSKMKIQEIVERSHAIGIDNIIITDHYENVSADYLTKFYISEPEKHMEDLRHFGLPTGLEFGWDNKTPINYPVDKYDFVLLSFHDIKISGNGNQKSYQEYLMDVLAGVHHFSDYTVLAHLDLPRRYRAGNPPFTKELYPTLELIFKKIIREGKGIELNCSTISSYGVPNPAPELLELYHRCGGKIVTLGSDAHEIETIGKNLIAGKRILEQIGFKYLYVWEKDEFVFKSLE